MHAVTHHGLAHKWIFNKKQTIFWSLLELSKYLEIYKRFCCSENIFIWEKMCGFFSFLFSFCNFFFFFAMSKGISEKVTFCHQEKKNPNISFFISEWVDSSIHLHYFYSNTEVFQTHLECWGGKTCLKYLILIVEKNNKRGQFYARNHCKRQNKQSV